MLRLPLERRTGRRLPTTGFALSRLVKCLMVRSWRLLDVFHYDLMVVYTRRSGLGVYLRARNRVAEVVLEFNALCR